MTTPSEYISRINLQLGYSGSLGENPGQPVTALFRVGYSLNMTLPNGTVTAVPSLPKPFLNVDLVDLATSSITLTSNGAVLTYAQVLEAIQCVVAQERVKQLMP